MKKFISRLIRFFIRLFRKTEKPIQNTAPQQQRKSTAFTEDIHWIVFSEAKQKLYDLTAEESQSLESKAKELANIGQPRPDVAELCPAERATKAKFQATIEDFQMQCEPTLNEWITRHKKAVSDLKEYQVNKEQTIELATAALIAECESQVQQLETTFQRGKEDLQDTSESLDARKEELLLEKEELADKMNIPLSSGKIRPQYWFLILASLGVFISETAAIFSSFLVLGEASFMTFALSLGIITIVICMGKVVGQSFKTDLHHKRWTSVFIYAVAFLIIIVGLYGIGLFRVRYVSANLAFLNAPELSIGETFTLWYLPIMMFVANCVFSYFSALTYPKLAKAFNRILDKLPILEQQFQTTQKSIIDTEKQFFTTKNQLQQQCCDKKKALFYKEDELKSNLAQISANINRYKATIKSHIKEINSKYKSCIASFRATNSKVRQFCPPFWESDTLGQLDIMLSDYAF